MTSKEILNEFWKDYKDTIRPRLLGWIRANKKSILRAPGRLKDSNGFVYIQEPRQIKTPTGNTYRSKLRAKIGKDYIEFITTTYSIINDSSTGRPRVIILPSAENYNYLISIDSHTLQRYNALVLKRPDLDIRSLVDEFIRADNTFSLQYDQECTSKVANSYIEFGGDNFGISWYNDETRTVDIKTFLLKQNLEKWQRELGISEFMPLTIYLKHKESNKVFESIVYPDQNQESLKARQMREAWEEYEKHR
jgi:hypothetical protein